MQGLDVKSKSEIIQLREKGVFILVLPFVYSPDSINKWEARIKQRRTELAPVQLGGNAKEELI